MIDQERMKLPEWFALAEALETVAVPCQTAPDDWFEGTPAQRAVAAERCLSCAVMVLCADYAEAAQEPSGVWGSVDRTRRGRSR